MNLMGSEVADIAAIESMKSFITVICTRVSGKSLPPHVYHLPSSPRAVTTGGAPAHPDQSGNSEVAVGASRPAWGPRRRRFKDGVDTTVLRVRLTDGACQL
jgi:hypothetical protein